MTTLGAISSSEIPSRHGADVAYARKQARGLSRFVPTAREPGPETWRAIGESLVAGDPQMDAVVEWMTSEGVGKTKPIFDRAVERGIAAVPDAPAVLRDFFATVERGPEWLDLARLEEGVRASALAGRMGNYVLRDFSLWAGYRASGINQTLVQTGALEKGPRKRIAETTKWWIDCTRPGGMQPFGPGYRSTLEVRLVHALVRRSLSRRADWDAASYGLPINQGDMHVTYLAFCVVYLLGVRALGVPIDREEAQAVMDLWRYIGWLMGVDERWLHRTEDDGRIALYQNLLSQAPPDETSRQLGVALVDEPLEYFYPNFPRQRGAWQRALHLSIVRALVGPEGMRDLGLPRGVVPWYPILTFVPRTIAHRVLRLFPAGRAYLVRRGLARQQSFFDLVAGTDRLTFAPHVVG